MTVSYWQYSASRLPPRAFDAVVVGGGIVGCSTAYWLRRQQPAWNIALVEAHHIAYGASGRNAGFLLKGTDASYAADVRRYGWERAALLWQLGAENLDLLHHHLTAENVALSTPGSWKLAGSPEEANELQEAEALLREDGFEATFYTQTQLEQKLPVKHFYGGLYVPGDGIVHSVRLVRHIGDVSGVERLLYHPVVALEYRGDQWHLDTTVRELHTPRLVLALNAYLPQLLPQTRPLITPRRAQMLATRPLPQRSLTWPVTSHYENYYFRELDSGVLLLGGARHQYAEQEVGYADEVTVPVQEALETYACTHILSHKPQVWLRWSGTMGFSPDGLPLIGEIGPQGYWVAGCSGHGMSWGFRIGQLMSHLLQGKEDPYSSMFHADRLLSTS